jgi:hypothetical protein
MVWHGDNKATLLYVSNLVSDPLYTGAFNFVNGNSTSAAEYLFDTNGNLSQDYNKGIAHIKYNLLNLPAVVQFTNGNRTDYLYGADGVKRRVIHTTAAANVSVPMGTIGNLTATQILQRDTIDYCGNLIYENRVHIQWVF